jgi:predicted RND superfamily exporter protein
LLGLENRAGIFRKDFLMRVDSLSSALAQLPHIRKVNSPTRLTHLSPGGLLPVHTRVLHIEDETAYPRDSALIYNSPYLVGSYFAANARSLSLFIRTEEGLSKTRSDRLAGDLDSLLGSYHFDGTHLVGRVIAQNVYLDGIRKELKLFTGLAVIIVILGLWFSFKSLYGVIVPLSVVVISTTWTFGIMALLGKPLDLMSTMLPTIIFVAGMSDVIHFFSKYYEELSKGTSRDQIYPLIIKEVRLPTFFTMLTTVVGFLSLLFADIQPVREFGLYASLGITLAFILTYTLLPALLYFLPARRHAGPASGHPLYRNVLSKLLFRIFRHPKTILAVTLLLLGLAVSGIGMLRQNNYLLEELSDQIPLKQDFDFFDRNYSGIRPFELSIRLRDSSRSIWDDEVIKALADLEDFVHQEYEAGFIASPSSLVRAIYHHSVNDEINNFPEAEDYLSIAAYLRQNRKSPEILNVVSPDARQTRLSGMIKDMGSFRMRQHNAHLQAFIKTHMDTSLFRIGVTGTAHLIDRNHAYMTENMKEGFLFSVGLIGLMTFLLHRSWRMVLVFIIPNLIPLVMISGLMGLSGIGLNTMTCLVFSIAFGIATDDTIHVISRLKIELDHGKSLLYAFKRTYFETSKPILLTTLVLLGGFISLTLSNFQSTFYFGLLTCLTLIIAVLADLFMLPVLLFMIYGKRALRNK